MPLKHLLASKLASCKVMMKILYRSRYRIRQGMAEGRAQGIFTSLRKFKRQTGSSNGCWPLHFFNPIHENGTATIMQSACSKNCSGSYVGGFARHGNVVDDALVDLLYNGRRVGLSQRGVGSRVWRVDMRPIAELVQQLR